jgi:hypothetical protein
MGLEVGDEVRVSRTDFARYGLSALAYVITAINRVAARFGAGPVAEVPEPLVTDKVDDSKDGSQDAADGGKNRKHDHRDVPPSEHGVTEPL